MKGAVDIHEQVCIKTVELPRLLHQSRSRGNQNYLVLECRSELTNSLGDQKRLRRGTFWFFCFLPRKMTTHRTQLLFCNMTKFKQSLNCQFKRQQQPRQCGRSSPE